MLGSRLFWKLFLGFTLVNLTTAAALVSSTWGWQESEALDLAEREVTTAATLLHDAALDWVNEPSDQSENRLRDLAESTRLSFRVTASSGAALIIEPEAGDFDAAIMEPRFLRDEGNTVGKLEVRRPTKTLNQALSRLWRRYSRYALVLLTLSIMAGFLIVAHLVGPVRALDRAARAMAAGNYNQRAFVANRDELGVLAQSFNQMSEDLGKQLGELKERDRRQATVLGGMIEGVIAIDGRRHVLFANAAAGKLFGFFPPQAEGRPLLDTVRNHALHTAVTAAVEARTPQRLEIDWDEQNLSVQVTPLVGEASSGAVIVLHDTTELRRLESLRRDFVANVSHELKTPLSCIKANAETLLRGAIHDKENRMRFLQGIDQQSDRLADLIGDMLSLARIESAQQPFDIASVSVSEAVESCVRDYEQRAAAKRVALVTEDANGAATAAVKADPEGLRVILNNLVDNAIKYTPAGGRVSVSWERSQDGDASAAVRIAVSDTGVGIPEEKLPRVFERFYRVDTARSRELGGTGLGLSIVKNLAQSFGGGVAVESPPEQGARFTVTLPAG